jgi:hypothetical protein
MLSQLCDEFQREVEALDPKADDYAAELLALVKKLVRDAAAHVADYHLGEIPALLELSRLVLAWLKSEAEDPADRSRRYARQRAVLDLLTFCENVRHFHASKGKSDDLAQFRAQVADALRSLVPTD